MFRARFWPITASPNTPMRLLPCAWFASLASAMVLLLGFWAASFRPYSPAPAKLPRGDPAFIASGAPRRYRPLYRTASSPPATSVGVRLRLRPAVGRDGPCHGI